MMAEIFSEEISYTLSIPNIYIGDFCGTIPLNYNKISGTIPLNYNKIS